MPSLTTEHGLNYQADRVSNPQRKAELAVEIKKFAAHCQKKTPLPSVP